MDELYHLTGIEDLSPAIINDTFERAEDYERRLADNLKRGRPADGLNDLEGVRVCEVFFEESTRTYSTFYVAAQILKAFVLGIPLAKKFSAFAEGKEESLEHAIEFWSGAAIPHLRIADIIIIRHFEVDACQRAARVSGVPIIDAGTGGLRGHHYTQSLLDAYSYVKFWGKKKSLKILFGGDLRFSRIIPTEIPILHMIFQDLKVGLAAPEGFAVDSEVKEFMNQNQIPFTEFGDVREAITSEDWEICYILRIQKNRLNDMEDKAELERIWDLYLKNRDRFAATKEIHALSEKCGTIICHPGPISSVEQEIRPEIEKLPRVNFLKQWAYGLPIRMAILTKAWEAQKKLDQAR